jgi:hypothetical protein
MLLPAMHPDPLPDDSEARNTLAARLANLALPQVQGEADSPIAARVSGQTYRVDANLLGLETITVNFDASGCSFIVNTPLGEEIIPCGVGAWHRGQTSMFTQPLLFGCTPVAACGAWTAETIFTATFRLNETPFFHTLVCHFVGDELMVEIRVNVSMESMEPLLLTARKIMP